MTSMPLSTSLDDVIHRGGPVVDPIAQTARLGGRWLRWRLRIPRHVAVVFRHRGDAGLVELIRMRARTLVPVAGRPVCGGHPGQRWRPPDVLNARVLFSTARWPAGGNASVGCGSPSTVLALRFITARRWRACIAGIRLRPVVSRTRGFALGILIGARTWHTFPYLLTSFMTRMAGADLLVSCLVPRRLVLRRCAWSLRVGNLAFDPTPSAASCRFAARARHARISDTLGALRDVA